MTDIFREVDEELRQERLKAIWSRYGLYIVAAAVLVVAAVGGYRFYESWQVARSGESGARYAEAVELLAEENFDQAMPLLEQLQSEGHGAYPVLARFQEAAGLAETGQQERAVTLYDGLAQDGDVESSFRELARLRAALLLIDTASPEDLSSRIGDLASDDGVWRHTAREILALSYYKAGDYGRADETFDTIMADPAAPARLKSRAEIMRTLIAPRLGAEET